MVNISLVDITKEFFANDYISLPRTSISNLSNYTDEIKGLTSDKKVLYKDQLN